LIAKNAITRKQFGGLSKRVVLMNLKLNFIDVQNVIILGVITHNF